MFHQYSIKASITTGIIFKHNCAEFAAFKTFLTVTRRLKKSHLCLNKHAHLSSKHSVQLSDK